MADLKVFHQMGLQAMGLPDALDETMLTPDGLRHGPGGPVGRALGCVLGGTAKNLLPQPGLGCRLLAAVIGPERRIFDDAGVALRRIPMAPSPDFMRINPEQQTILGSYAIYGFPPYNFATLHK